MNPGIIRKESLIIAGVTGDGSRTGELWQDYISLSEKTALNNKISDNGYEIRLYTENECMCHVGVSVSDKNTDSAYAVIELPASEYASFDVYAANGYESENASMDKWLASNMNVYRQKMLDGKPYVVEFYGDRYHGNEPGSVVEIWLPIEKIG